MFKAGFVMPHPPLILPHVGGGREREVQKTIDACEECAREIARLKPEVIVISSPHYSEDIKQDHGSTVPLYFVNRHYQDYELYRVGLSWQSYDAHFALGVKIAERFADKTAVFIASGDMSHKLKHDGPYGFIKEGPEFDKAVCDVFTSGRLNDLLKTDPDFAEKAAECGLRSFIIMAGALDGSEYTSRLLSYEGTFGVGYAVASFIVKE